MTGIRAVAAVLLDMDGTLVDSDAAVARAWDIWARAHHIDHDAVMAISPGQPAAVTIGQVAPHLSTEDVDREARVQLGLQYQDLDDVVAAPGALELIETLAMLRIPWAVVTSADRRLARARLGAARIEPPQVITVEDVTEGKPAPDGYLLAAARLGVEPRRALVVEDSAAGIEAGRRAPTVISLSPQGLAAIGQLSPWG